MWPAGAAEGPQGPDGAGRPAQPTVILRLEAVRDRTAKNIVLGLWASGLVSLGFLAWTTTAKFHEDQSFFLRNSYLQQVSVALGSACLAAALLTLGTLCRALLWVLRRGLRWPGARGHAVGLVAVPLVLQTANLGLWMANMIITWAGSCAWFDRSVDILACIQWTIWNALFHLNVAQASLLLPTGAWQALAETTRMRARVWWRRCCCSSDEGGSTDDSTRVDSGESAGTGDDSSGVRCGKGVGAAAEGPAGGEGSCSSSSWGPSCGLKETPAGALALQNEGTQAAGSAVAAGSTASRAAAAGFSILPGAAAVHGRAAAVAGAAAPAAAAAAAAAEALAGAAVRLEERIRLSLMAVMLLLVWLPNQVLIIVLTLRIVGEHQWEWNGQVCYDPADPACAPPTTPCTEWAWQCRSAGGWLHLTYGVGTLFLASVLCFLLLTWMAMQQLGARPYRDWRVRNLALRIFLHTRVATYLLFVLTLALTFYDRLKTCTSVLLVWLGLGPMQVAMTATVVSEAVLFMPVREPHAAAVKLHDALQRFAWTEADVPALVADRGFPEEPCFCVETALKCLYLSLHAYNHFKGAHRPRHRPAPLRPAPLRVAARAHPRLQLPAGLGAWHPGGGLQGHRLAGKRQGGHKGGLLLEGCSFPTAPRPQVWRAPHPPLRGAALLGRRPLVHQGFLASWLCGGYGTQVLQRIREVLQGQQQHHDLPPCACTADRCCAAGAPSNEHLAAARAAAAAQQSTEQQAARDERIPGGSCVVQQRAQPFRVIITGHSLGGAMATLCAIDVAKALPDWGLDAAPALLPLPAGGPLAQGAELPGPAVSLSVYTFGAPRTGNHAFARDFNAYVPDCWSLINGQDVVANRGKFWVLFKRQGKAVLLGRRGDVIVRPAAIEQSAHTFLGASVRAHFLQDSYARSLAVFLRLQLAGRGKAMPGGPAAVAAMRAVPAMARVLEQVVPLYEVQATHRGMPRGRRRTQGGEAGRGRGECTAGGKAESNSPDGGGLAADSSASLDV